MGSLRASLIFLYLLSASTAVVSQPQTKAVTLFDGHEVASIVCDTDANVPIAKAASLLAGDLLKLTGRKASIAATPNKMGRVAIMVGLATEPAVSAVLKGNNISTAAIEGKWESYGRVAVPDPGDPERTILLGCTPLHSTPRTLVTRTRVG